MIENETQYDSTQLASMQGDLRDNSIYSGIGIVPGTDLGGSSEGGENGSSGTNSGSEPGTRPNTGGTNTNIGGSDGGLLGEEAVPPTISVIEGEQIAASFFRGDVTVQIATFDKSQKIKYILTTSVSEINKELYPSGLVREIDIENGGTLTFTKDGEYTITAYSYDTQGRKSNSSVMWIKRESTVSADSGISLEITNGNMGEKNWYNSNIVIRVLGTDVGSNSVTYRVIGTAYGNGTIGGREYSAGEIDTLEVPIANGTTFRITLDGEFSVVAYTYDAGGVRLSTSDTLKFKRDASRPIVTMYKGEQVVGSGFQISMASVDYASGLNLTDRYTYRYKLATTTDYIDDTPTVNTTRMYTGLAQDKTYDMYAIIKDEAGNVTASDVVSKPALWISNTPTVGDTVSGGAEGARKYCSTDVDVSMTGQDGKNVKISKTTYQIIGTTTSAGTMDGVSYAKGVALPETETEIENKKTIQIRADGNWIIKIHTYDEDNVKITTNTYEVTRDTVNPSYPTIEVASGTMGDSTYYRSNINVRVTGTDDTCFKKVTYTVTGTATGAGTIGSVSITNGQNVNIAETELTNGGTFTIAADGRWTIKGYTYDKAGRKSEIAPGITITRDMVDPVADTPVVTVGTQGDTNYYRSDITVKISGSDVTSYKKMTYTISGTVKKAGTIAGQSVSLNQNVNFAETEIANNGTFDIAADGTWTITAYAYDMSGRSKTSTALVITRDTVNPVITKFSCTARGKTTLDVSVTASDGFSGWANSGGYLYYKDGTFITQVANNTYQYTGLNGSSEYNLKVIVKDKAGNTAEKSFSQKTLNFLVDVVTVGDYVAYDAGTWGSSGNGVTTGTNKGKSVNSYSNSNKAATDGWRVLKVSGSGQTGNVYLISAGVVATIGFTGMTVNYNTYMHTSNVTSLNNFIANNFKNATWASSATSVTYNDVQSNNDLLKINSYYWTADVGYSTNTKINDTTTYYYYWNYFINPTGSRSTAQGGTYGVRPVVTLKAGICTGNSMDTTFLEQQCWSLID